MTTHAFYLTRADEERQAADAAPLANVRDRCLRAAEAWDVMAQRAARMIRHREEEAGRRALREDAAALLLAAASQASPGH